MLFSDDLLVQPGIAHGDGRLVGEALQQLGCVAAKDIALRLKDVNHAYQGIAALHGEQNRLRQIQIYLHRLGQFVDALVNLGQRILLGALFVGYALEQDGKAAKGFAGNAQRGRDPKLFLDGVGQHHQPRPPRNKIYGGLQNNAKHVAKVKLGRERPANGQQILSLADANIN